MKNYKFKWEALLKVKILKEKKIKQNISQITSEMFKMQKLIEGLEREMMAGYRSQEKDIQSGSKARVLKVYPLLFESQIMRIEDAKNRLLSLKGVYKKKMHELNQIMGEVEVMEKMKDNDWKRFKNKGLQKRTI